MKLQLKKPQVVETQVWHPNFRNAELLPDLKVIRTSFFVNLTCITAVAAAVLFTAYREFMAFSMRADIVSAEERVETARAQNNQFLELNREFTQATRSFSEAGKFVQSPFRASELIVALSRTLPANMDFTSIAYEGNQLVLKGSIRGASDSASSLLSAYLDLLRKEAAVGGLFPDISLTNMLRDPRTQGLSFEIVLKGEAPRPASA